MSGTLERKLKDCTRSRDGALTEREPGIADATASRSSRPRELCRELSLELVEAGER